MKRALLLAAVVAATPAAGSAQISERVRDTDDGTVRFSYPVRPDVQICDQGVQIGDSHAQWHTRGRDRNGTGCRTDVAEVELTVRRGSVRSLELVTEPGELDPRADDLGRIEPEAAARYLLGLAYQDASDDAAEEAILPALIADAPDMWRELLDLARDRGAPSGVRKNALFWLGQEASAAATDGLVDVALDDEDEQDVRDAAVFALSQRPPEESVPMLMDVVRSTENAETRRRAMFWLAQSDDPRVIDFFEQVLLGRVR